MKTFTLGIDYGGVISFAPEAYGEMLQRLQQIGHKVYIVSHALPGNDHQNRTEFANKYGLTDLTFSDLTPQQEDQVRQRKAEIVQQYEIDLFIDDSMERCRSVELVNRNCTCIFAPQGHWDLTFEILKTLSNENN